MPRGRPARCPYCGGNSINKGFRLTKTMGKRRLKQCKACRRKFTPKNQKPIELTEDKAAEANTEPDEAQDAGVSNEATESNREAPKPASDSKPLLNALDEEWTS